MVGTFLQLKTKISTEKTLKWQHAENQKANKVGVY